LERWMKRWTVCTERFERRTERWTVCIERLERWTERRTVCTEGFSGVVVRFRVCTMKEIQIIWKTRTKQNHSCMWCFPTNLVLHLVETSFIVKKHSTPGKENQTGQNVIATLY
jgi:hypothetical protein